jgi:hypothetical protein
MGRRLAELRAGEIQRKWSFFAVKGYGGGIKYLVISVAYKHRFVT